MDRGAWRATVHRVTKSWTRLSQLSMHAMKHIIQLYYILLNIDNLPHNA